MSETMTKVEFDPAKFDRWIMQVADATISDEDMASLLRMCLAPGANVDVRGNRALSRRLAAAIKSYCHVLRSTRDYRDEDVDLETSVGLVAKCERGEALTDEDLRLIGKRSSDRQASRNLERAFFSVLKPIRGLPLNPGAPFVVVPVEFYTTLSDEQFAVLVQSLFEQAVVHGSGDVSEKTLCAQSASECPYQARKLFIARGISLLTDEDDPALPYSKLSPEEKAEHDWTMESIRRSICGLPPADG